MNTSYVIVDDTGMPTASMDIDKIQEDGMNLAFNLAAHCGDETKTEQLIAEAVKLHGPRGIGYVLIAAIKDLTNDMLAGAFDVMETTTGLDPRTKMAEIGGMTENQATAAAEGINP